jgi:transcription-repair coupling factor (superfamily II helicase)
VEDSGQKLHLYRRLSRVGGRREVDALGREMADRYGVLPPEVGRLLDASVLRLLGRSVGVERILVRERSARLNFRAGVVPHVAALEGPLRQRQVEVEVRRMDPLSLVLNQVGAEPLTETLMMALEALKAETS